MTTKSKTFPEFRADYDREIKYLSKMRDFLGLTAIFSITGRAYNISRGDEFFPTTSRKPLMMRFDYDGGFGNKVVGDVILNPTWLDVWKAADKAVRESGDLHHIYLEGVEFKRMVGEIMVFELSFGS